MTRVLWLILICLLTAVLVLSSCARNVPEAPPQAETETTITAPPPKAEEGTSVPQEESEGQAPEEKGWIKPAEQVSGYPAPQGMGPTVIATTEDREYAYIGFHLSDSIFKVRLESLTVEAVADLSGYFPLQCYNVALDSSERKLFVHSASRKELLVLDTRNMSVIHTIENVSTVGMNRSMLRSQQGTFLTVWDGSHTVKFVNTEDYKVTDFTDSSIAFLQIEESKSDPSKWYVATKVEDRWVVGLYDPETKKWDASVSVTPPQDKAFVDLRVLPDGSKAYLAIWGDYYPESQTHSYGWLYSIDMHGGGAKAIPIDGSEWSLEMTPDGRRVLVGTDWPKPTNTNNIQVVDTRTDAVVGSINLSELPRLHFTAVMDMQIVPSNPGFLYAVGNDANALIKADLDGLTPVDTLVFNQESFQPNFFVKRPGQATGYILIHESAATFEFDLDKETITNIVKFPQICPDADSYRVAINSAGNLFIAQGETILEVDPKDMRLLGMHPLPQGISGLGRFVLSNDGTRIYSIRQDLAGGREYPDVFLALDATTFQVKANFKLDGGVFNERLFELPDGSKLYALGGRDWGTITIHVIETANYTISKTLTYDDPADPLGISAGPYYPFAYDASSHTLFVGAATVVLAIDTDTDTIKKVMNLKDMARAIGFEPSGTNVSSFVYVNAMGLVYNPNENYLYIAHFDRSFVSIYDLNNDQFLPQVIPLKGYLPNYLFANDDYSKIYSLNGRSDSVSVIDVKSKAVEKVIDLHTYR